jgi:O-antigen/teichoic acid export membrane protein
MWRKSALVLGARIVSAVLQAVTILLLARSLGPSDLGSYFTVVSVFAGFSALVGFGMNTRALRLAAEDHAAAKRSTMTWMRLVTALIGGALSAWLGSLFLLDTPVLVLIAAASYAASELVNELSQSIMLGSGRVGAAVGLMIVRRAAPFAAVIWGLAQDDATLLFGLTVACGITTVYGLVVQRGLLSRPSSPLRLIASSRHYWWQSIWAAAQQVDVLVVQLFLGSSAAGLYAAASRLLSPLNLVTSSLLSVLVPEMSRFTDRRKILAVYARAKRLIGGYAVALAVASPLAGFVGPLILGSEYQASWSLFIFFVLAAGFNAASQPGMSLLYAIGEARKVAAATFISTLVGLCLLAILAALGAFLLLGLYSVVAFAILFVLVAWSVRKVDIR